MQLEAVWNQFLYTGSEGPTLISCAASWRTYGRKIDRTVLEWCEEALKQIEEKGKEESFRKKPGSPPKKLKKKWVRGD